VEHRATLPDAVIRYLKAWYNWRKRRPHPSQFATYEEWKNRYLIWRDQKPKLT
jgi:hypothetical protein